MKIGLRELIFGAVLVAVPTTAWFSVFEPTRARMDEQQGEIDRKKGELAQLAALKTEIEDLDRAIEEGRQLIDVIHGKLPTQELVEEILDQVWQTTVGNGLTVKSVKADAMEDGGFYQEQPLEMVVEGGFDGFYRFLLELENLPRITRLHNMKLERLVKNTGGTRDIGTMKATFTLSIYHQPSSRGGRSRNGDQGGQS